MSESHKLAIPIIYSHCLTMGLESTWMNPTIKQTGEKTDLFSCVDMALADLWDGCNLWPGQCITHEYKRYLSDLRAEKRKPWRTGEVPGLGDWRITWIDRVGEIRPEHVDEDTGWGVGVFDEHSFEIVRPPQQFYKVAHATQLHLVRVLDRLSARDTESSRTAGARTALGSVSSAKRQIQGVPKLAKQIAEWMGSTPATTGECKRFLRSVGDERSPRQIEKMMRDSGLFIPPSCDGGTWQTKANAAESA